MPFCSSFPNAKQENVEALITLIRTTIPSELCSVKVTKKDVVVPKTTVVVTCSANVCLTESRLPVLFEPDFESPWTSGLEVPETQVTLRGGTSPHVAIWVTNNTEHVLCHKML